MRAARKLTRYFIGNSVVYGVHKLVYLCLRLVKLNEYRMLHNKLIKLVNTLLYYIDKERVALLLNKLYL